MQVKKQERDKLRELALAATQGQWTVNGGDGLDMGDDRVYIGDAENAAYIAAANPKTVLALLDRIDELEGDAEPVNNFDLLGNRIAKSPPTERAVPEGMLLFPKAAWRSLMGMTLRDYFAGQALQGFLASIGVTTSPTDADIARYSYDVADAMLEARNITAPSAGGGE